MTILKERKTLTLDSDVVAAFEDGNLSGEVNQILREEIARRQARAALAAYIDGLAAEFGAPDPAQVEEFRRELR
ncbi:MAG: hypothetical protein LBI99_03590 [Propionibacteriaceae bacterium]|jgi:hypothetical protein|nr:hypothetical protein [Propionibacteriaceae bacterium]